MNCHQVLTGAVNSGDKTYSVGSVEGIHFTAYVSGCNIVILAPNFERVQIIPGVLHENVQVNCIDASTDVGKIAACYGGPIKANNQLVAPNYGSTNRIFIFEPTPVIGQRSENRLDYNWIKTAEIEPNSAVNVMSWNIEGTKLLTGGTEIQLWCLSKHNERPVTPQVEEDGLQMKSLGKPSHETPPKHPTTSQLWACVWSCRTSTPVLYLAFSPDSTMFCSVGKADRLAKIWQQSATQTNMSSLLDTLNASSSQAAIASCASLASMQGIGQSHHCSNLSFSFIYIAHPRAVTGISWRKSSKYMPKGAVANMLVTSCRDNICRLWVQTLLPEDGLVNVSHLEGVNTDVNTRMQTQRHRQKILTRLKHIKTFSNFKRRQHMDHDLPEERKPIPTLPSTYSIHDFHGFSVHGNSISPGGLHFHLTATINAESDIPLVPSLARDTSDKDLPSAANKGPKVTVSSSDPNASSSNVRLHHHEESDKPLFVVHWLDNKEMNYTQNAERILHEIVSNIVESERQQQLHKQQQEQAEQETASQGSNEERPKSSQDMVAQSNFSSSSNSLATVAGAGLLRPSKDIDGKSVADYLDRKLESLMREWHNSTDLLYSIHPLDGSLLIW